MIEEELLYQLADYLWMNCDYCEDNIWCNEYDNNHDCNCKCHHFAIEIRRYNEH